MIRILLVFGFLGMLPLANKAQSRQLFPELSKLGTGVNSAFAESHPVISSDGKTLFFSRKNHPQNFGEDNLDDIWVSYLQTDSTWSKAANIGAPLNNKEANSVVAFDPLGTVLYLTDVYRSDKKGGIAVARRVGRSWSKPESLGIEDFYNQSPQVAYHLSVDGAILLMSVQREEGFGGRDLFVSFENSSGEWSRPLNLGPAINTVGEESSVFLAADGKTIYFSSNWHSSFGGLDIFVSRRLDDSWTRWSEPKNLGKGINTPGNDSCFTLPASGDFVFFASNAGGENPDLFRIALPSEFQPEPVVLLNGTVIDAETRQPLEAKLTIQNLDFPKNFKRLNTKKDGSFELVLPYSNHLAIVGERAGYFAISEIMELGDEPLEEPDFNLLDLTASVSADSLSFSNLEIDKLQVRVNGLEVKVKALETARKEIRQKNLLPLPSKTFSEDPELDALREVFDKQLHQNNSSFEKGKAVEFTAKGTTELGQMPVKLDTVSRSNRTDTISSRAILRSRKSPHQKAELAELKRNYYRQKGLGIPSGLQKNEAVVTNAAELQKYSFEKLENEIWRNLEREYYVEIKRDLQKELLDVVKNKLAEELDSKGRKQLNNSELDRQLRSSNAADAIKEELQHRFSGVGKLETRGEWEEEIKEEMRKILSKEVKAQLRRTLRKEVLEELRLELEYSLTKELQRRLQEELETKLQKQMLAEQKRQKNAARKASPPKEEKREPVFREIHKNIALAPIKQGQVIPLNSVFFEVNQTTLKQASFAELKRLLTFLQSNPGLVIEIGLHTNGGCTYSFAEELTAGRAKVLATFFIKNGIPESQIQSKGYGRTQPVASNSTLAGRKENQRVEVMILKTE